ncbi:HEAT repeat domain-containing protein [Kitasatospora sp. NPDC088134]|uniref:HEAT repeat domain-containing protein n=1 Tax=Kitasatospora sp. NPDC088134 TaxID=3364071 RepID=UPI00382C72F4
MDLSPLLAAIDRADVPALCRLLDARRDGRGVGPGADALPAGAGAVLLAAAVRGGGPADLAEALLVAGADPLRAGPDGEDLVEWAARHGKDEVLDRLLCRTPHDLTAGAAERALRAARRALAEAGPLPGRWAVVTSMETRAGTPAPPDELLRRALVHADPAGEDWSACAFPFARFPSAEFLAWARARYADAPSVAQRRFAVEVLVSMGLGVWDAEDDPTEEFAPEAAFFLRPVIGTEPDGHALHRAIHAYAWYAERADVADTVLPHRHHPEPDVRAAVAHALGYARHRPDPRPAAALTALAADASPRVRRCALRAFAFPAADGHDPRPLLLAALADPDLDVRLSALNGLVKHGDTHAPAALERLAADVAGRYEPGWLEIDCLRDQLRLAAS